MSATRGISLTNPDPRLYGVYSAAVDLGITNLDLVQYQMPSNFFSGVTFGDEFLNDQGANEGGGIQINGTTQADVLDGQKFTLDSGSGPVTFEFDWDNAFDAGTEVIGIRNPSDSNPVDPLTFSEVGDAMVDAINASPLGVTAVYNGQGVVGLPLDQLTFAAGTSTLSLSTVESEYFNEVKSFLDRSRSPDPAGELPFYSVILAGVSPGTLTFTPNGPDRPGSENLLYGDQTVIPNNMIAFGSPFNFTIIADPTSPVANDDTVATPEDTALAISSAVLLANDTAASGRTLSVVSIDVIPGTTLGTLNGSTYTPPANYFGQDVVSYTIRDNTGLTSSARVTINVSPVNDAPVAVDDNFSVDEDSTGNVLTGILSNDNGGPGENTDTLTITGLGVTSNGGTVSIVAGGQSVNYSPAPGFVGTETFTYTVSDQGGLTDTATVSVDVNPLTLPRARTDRPVVEEDSSSTPIDVLANDSANEGAQKVLIGIVSQPSNGTAVVDTKGTPDQSDDVINYTPNANFSGTDTFTYSMTDDAEDSVPSTGTVVVTVNAQNDPVILVDDTATATEDTVATIPVSTLLANDSPGAGEENSQTLTITSVTAVGAGGSVALVGSNVIYTPTPNFNGQFTFTYSASDNGTPVSSGTATVVVTVNPVNDNPIAGDDAVETNEDTLLPIAAATLLANDSAGPSNENQTLSITAVSPASAQGGSVTLSGSTINYTPALNFFGQDTLYVYPQRRGWRYGHRHGYGDG